jgi:hypothetical protein
MSGLRNRRIEAEFGIGDSESAVRSLVVLATVRCCSVSESGILAPNPQPMMARAQRSPASSAAPWEARAC